MKLLKVEIEGINHKTNITFDLTAPETILIGENGIGKSTALSILNALTKGDMVSIAKCVFDRIIISDDVTTHIILQSDCQIAPDIVASWLERDLSENNTPQYINTIIQRFLKMCEELQQKDLYGQFLSELIMNIWDDEHGSSKLWSDFDIGLNMLNNFNQNDELRISFKNFLDKADERDPDLIGHIFHQYRKKNMSRFSKSILKIIGKYVPFTVIEDLVIWTDECYCSGGASCFPGSKVRESIYIQNINNSEYGNLECIYSDLVNQVSFEDEGIVWVDFQMFKETGNRVKTDLYNYFYSDTYESASDFLSTMENETVAIKYGGVYSSDYEKDKENVVRSVLDMCRHKQFDINSVISYMCFNQTVANNINKQAICYEHDCINKLSKGNIPTIEDVDRLVECYDEDLLLFSDCYVQPFLGQAQPFKRNIKYVIVRLYDAIAKDKPDLIKSGFYFLSSYYEFCKTARQLFQDKYEVPKDARRFLDFIENYIHDKSFTVTPGGLIMHTNDPDSNEKKQKSHEMSLNMLSSGEKKIVLLGCLAVVATKVMLILDEPELSMTLLWQRRLLKDLIDTGGFSNIIVATHSPFIAADIQHQKYLQYLE